MVEFMSGYMPAMDRFEEQPVPATQNVDIDIEKPIIPVGEIGTTSVNQGRGNILQELENNIKFGTKKIQIVFTAAGGGGGPSSGPSSYGKEVRQSLFEKAKATGVELIGVELNPNMVSGLAGFDPRSNRITEENRFENINKVKDAIRFAADVSKGGAVDLWSQEFNRTISDARWNKEAKNPDDKKWLNRFYSSTPEEIEHPEKANLLKYLIDDRTGNPIQASVVRTGEKTQELRYMTAEEYEKQFNVKIVGTKDKNGNMRKKDDSIDYEGNAIDPLEEGAKTRMIPYMNPETHQFEKRDIDWNTIVENTKKFNERYEKKIGRKLEPEEYLYRQHLETQQAQVRGQSLYYSREIEGMYDQLRDLVELKNVSANLEKSMNRQEQENWIRETVLPKAARTHGITEREIERLLQKKPSDVVQDLMIRQENAIRGYQEQAASQKIQEAEIEEMKDHIVTPQTYGFDKSIDSYSALGIDAMKVTQERKLEKPIYIGPEIGWASESYGGHPDEFIELIKKSREKMAEKLKAQGYDEGTAKEKAKTHIKGMMDTSHLAMWYKHFQKKPGQSDEAHLKEFNEWMKHQAKKMVKEGVVGGVQVVDTFTGEHAHLPAGQGNFEVAELVKAMKEAGFNGPIISEGHEEDTGGFGQGRILTEAWRAFGSNISSLPPGEQRMGLRGWGGIQHSYFGQVAPPTYIVGAYAPSNEWSLWSETPFE